ncbi:Alkyl hydroperoxide reductase subunit C-like protein [hydrothermal vent metagenome]|uniref:thioredoxin-dependent peroxiredoxin n=1 Tax=hydrothermal vent metagenome TaxID=652676 RepID=A0A3B0REZ0_9ZZZZ
MNFLKSVFVVTFITASMVISIYAGKNLYQGGNLLAWIGVLLANAPFIVILSAIMMFKPTARTSEHFPVIIGLGLLGIVFAAQAWWQQSGPELALMLAVLGWVSFLIYLFWYSVFRNRNSQIKVGQPLPAFALKNTDGDKVTSKQLSDKASIFMFYRGNWCPLCMAQVKELAAMYQQLAAANIRTALVSPQPHKNTVTLAQKFDVGFEFYTDTDNKAAQVLGISNPFGVPMGMQVLGYDSETVLPTVIITDAKGKVIWLHETDNYRVRPEPDVFLQVLRENGITV